MLNDNCSRRVFLKKFAILSAGSLTLSAITLACYGPGPSVNAVYGPAPNNLSLIGGILYLDAQSSFVLLNNSQNVPVNTQFKVEFNFKMDTTPAATSISFTDPNNNQVAVTKNWNADSQTLMITPSSVLLNNTNYTLTIVSAVSTESTAPSSLTDNVAKFKTVA